ncbi:MAG: hypothetical protein Q8N51_11945 [Gammaproteobacteria bacterium]|nr:hypothetical protein [Gammaproteobacteria bacterium]
MKVAMAILVGILLPGCMAEMLVTTAITADMAAQQADTTLGTMNQAKMDTDLVLLRDAIKYYQMENGGYPPDLGALVPVHIAAIPTRPDGAPFGYNPVSGEVYESAEGPAPADYLMMESLKQAVNAYGTQTGYYPPTLDVLYPTFVQRPPRTASGQPFTYNNQNGQITHPDEGRQFARSTTDPMPNAEPVPASRAIGSLQKGDLKDGNSLNKALDRIGY